MAILVGPEWVGERIGSPGFLLIDPRRPMKYLAGHLKNAVNLPAFRAFDEHGKLLAPDALATWIGGAGLGEATTPVLYDSPDGRNAAMLAWILEYLGRIDVHVLHVFFERWKAEGAEVFYRPVEAAPQRFAVRLNPGIRATLEDVRAPAGARLVDFRSEDEYTGVRDLDGRPGHIPHAVNVVWIDLTDPSGAIAAPGKKIDRLLSAAGIGPGDKIIAYCRTGPRAALGYLVLRHYGYDVRLYDGSYAQWARNGLPAEK
jgi:thiosulfate/3-mercaptopyruvate sulfurtransferase